MNYYLTRQLIKKENAGLKAPSDINSICDSIGWKNFPITSIVKDNRGRYLCSIFKSICDWIRLFFKTDKNDFILYQHPMYSGIKLAKIFFKLLSIKGINSIILLHDIEHLRNTDNQSLKKEELTLFSQFNYIICHNTSMQLYLEDQGLSTDKIITLELFDYLSNDFFPFPRSNSSTLTIAGNLDKHKCSYIYDLALNNPTINLHLYGVNYSESEINNIEYKGVFKPDELPRYLDGSYGLVWDGNSISSCDGVMGNYLRYNNPHKLSLFIAAGMPVIAWRESAIAKFITDNNCGLVVDSLYDLDSIIGKISDDDYDCMRASCCKLSERVRSGYYLKAALNQTGVFTFK